MLREAISGIGVPVVGTIGRCSGVETPSRHLGLIPAAERAAAAVDTVQTLGDLITKTVDLDAVLAIARTAPPLTEACWNASAAIAGVAGVPTPAACPAGARATHAAKATPTARATPVRIAVAAGPAFTFSYTETAELLAAAGAEVVTFDPLHDAGLPHGTRGVIIGGGFPEEHAEALSANASLRAELAAFPGPIYAECAGLLYLCQRLDDVPMCGLLPTSAHMTSRLTLGYREATATVDSIVARAGDTVRGHEFHHTVTDPRCGTATSASAWDWDSTGHGFVSGLIHASYLHTHWAGCPEMAVRLVAAASACRATQQTT